MAVLLLRLAGPMQSWGTQSRFSNRDTELEPSKSGVVGLSCAALGSPRDDTETIQKLAALKMGVRVDREGSVKKDYQTAQNVAKAGGGIKPTEISDRFYLADAVFLVALEGDVELLKKIDAALQRPAWQLFLGRKAFVPGLPVWLKDGFLPEAPNLEDALNGYPYLCAYSKLEAPSEDLRMELEVGYGRGDKVRQDQPESFDIYRRCYGSRYLVSKNIRRSVLPEPKEELCIFLA